MLTTFAAMLIAMLLAAFWTTVFFIGKRRRRIPKLKLDLDSLPSLDDGLATLAGLTGAPVHCSNSATLFQNGALFDAMQSDIAAAQHTVHLESFVWTAGVLERRFVDLLIARAAAGVQVRMTIDAVGAGGADPKQLQRLRDSGVELSMYNPIAWWNLRRLNHRTHRKLLIVDGHIGYAFGHGISDQWLGEGQDKTHWRDTGVRVEGAVVQALQSVFMQNWIEETRRVPSGEGCFPALRETGTIAAHVVSSDAGEAVSSVSLLYTLAIASARREVIIQNPYFVPGRGVVELLTKMVERGVAVHLMVPGKHTDSRFVRRAGTHLYEGLMRAGVRLYEFEPTLIHQKVVIVDGIWSHIGSTNFDARSLALNEEVGLGLLDAGLAAQLKAAFDQDLLRSREMTPELWKKRGWFRTVFAWFAYQLHEQL
ncbi:phospholipase D-like domain-containing protein [Hydrocarboniphaga sp.]|uniref:phospholipase D-like domain-containing protein n=1 Tax=Hydrocarboniphaga sp. TaxID=2033016 RepID=UPI003D0D222B